MVVSIRVRLCHENTIQISDWYFDWSHWDPWPFLQPHSCEGPRCEWMWWFELHPISMKQWTTWFCVYQLLSNARLVRNQEVGQWQKHVSKACLAEVALQTYGLEALGECRRRRRELVSCSTVCQRFDLLWPDTEIRSKQDKLHDCFVTFRTEIRRCELQWQQLEMQPNMPWMAIRAACCSHLFVYLLLPRHLAPLCWKYTWCFSGMFRWWQCDAAYQCFKNTDWLPTYVSYRQDKPWTAWISFKPVDVTQGLATKDQRFLRWSAKSSSMAHSTTDLWRKERPWEDYFNE